MSKPYKTIRVMRLRRKGTPGAGRVRNVCLPVVNKTGNFQIATGPGAGQDCFILFRMARMPSSRSGFPPRDNRRLDSAVTVPS